MRDPVASVLSALSIMDWMSPAYGLGQDAVHAKDGPSWTFFISLEHPPTIGDTMYMLKNHGIDPWGSTVDYASGTWYVSVPLDQAQWADELLAAAGSMVVDGHDPPQAEDIRQRAQNWGDANDFYAEVDKAGSIFERLRWHMFNKFFAHMRGTGL